MKAWDSVLSELNWALDITVVQDTRHDQESNQSKASTAYELGMLGHKKLYPLSVRACLH